MHEVGKLWSARQKAGTTEGRKLRLLSLTFDPETDSPAVLASYSELVRRDVPDWIFATGPEELMEKALPSMFDVIARRNDQGTLNHTVRVALLGPGLRAQQIWTDNAFTPKEVVERVLR
jgi:protein SCO1/2